jgi:hypothetical protein
MTPKVEGGSCLEPMHPQTTVLQVNLVVLCKGRKKITFLKLLFVLKVNIDSFGEKRRKIIENQAAHFYPVIFQ